MNCYTAAQAAEHAAAWCKRHPAWMRICDLPNGYIDDHKGLRECFITGAGAVVPTINDVPFGHNLIMCFKVSKAERRRLEA